MSQSLLDTYMDCTSSPRRLFPLAAQALEETEITIEQQPAAQATSDRTLVEPNNCASVCSPNMDDTFMSQERGLFSRVQKEHYAEYLNNYNQNFKNPVHNYNYNVEQPQGPRESLETSSTAVVYVVACADFFREELIAAPFLCIGLNCASCKHPIAKHSRRPT